MSDQEYLDASIITTEQDKMEDATTPQQNYTLPAPETFRVGVRIPPFWPEKPSIWFSQIEGQFAMARITDDNTKYYYVLSHLDRQFAVEVEDIITSPPSSGKYEKIKSELIKRLSTSSERKVKQLLQSEELGDRKPSQFLRHLQHLAGPNIPEDFLRTIWTSRLPNNLQTVIASQMSLSLNELADLADRVHDIAPSSPQVAATSATSTQSALEMMARSIAELTKQVSSLSADVHGRSRPRNRQSNQQSNQQNRQRTPSTRSQSNYRKFPQCWYHFKFGSQAKKCVKPCDYKSGNAQGNL
ncbi:uncharacterized protein LOC135078288 [Ostrinia nubilalis]|uniref:uncharacterized protein LOC135078288 n=1 Tax=Ostrinia nubilalis TaxID=29057 RepID=UPI0030822D1C